MLAKAASRDQVRRGTQYRTERVAYKDFNDTYIQAGADDDWTLYMVIPLMLHNHLHPTFIVVWMKGPNGNGTPMLNNLSGEDSE